MSSSSLLLLAMGNPLLDMQVVNKPELLDKYGLKPNDAILAEGKQGDIYADLQANYQVEYVAGGAAQNAARGAQYVLPEGSTAYLGAVGSDKLADQLRAANDKEGLHSAYQVVDDKPTGACAVIITGHDRCVPLSLSLSLSLALPQQQQLTRLSSRTQLALHDPRRRRVVLAVAPRQARDQGPDRARPELLPRRLLPHARPRERPRPRQARC